MLYADAVAGPSEAGARPLVVKAWGTRGSVPTPGRTTAGHGGNTSCLEVCAADGRCFVFDAGSGIRRLGEHLVAGNGGVRAELFLTHFHWDHIQGLPFFAPLYDAASELRIHGAPQNGVSIADLIAAQMQPVYFPVPFDAVAARLEFRHLDAEPMVFGDVRVTAFRVRHPSDTYGYRIEQDGVAVAYVPDNELSGGTYDVAPDWRDRLVEFVAGADVLYHDAMYTAEEYARREGWGHSTFEQAVSLAEEAGVRRLQLFHHAPEREDADLERIVERLRNSAARRGSRIEIDAAVEGVEHVIEERGS